MAEKVIDPVFRDPAVLVQFSQTLLRRTNCLKTWRWG
jgi:hypothetical protein